MLESGKITRSGGTSKGSAQKDTLLREASKALIRQGKMWVIASRRRGHDGGGHTEGAGCGRAAARGEAVPGHGGLATDAGLGPVAGGGLAGGSGAGGRQGREAM